MSEGFNNAHSITVTEISDSTFEALSKMAAENGRTIEQEIVAIIEFDLREKTGLGSELAAIGRRYNLHKLDDAAERAGSGRVVFE